MSATTEVPDRGESTSPGLSSPPSPNSPTRRTATPTSVGQSNTASYARHGQIDANVGGEKIARGIGAKNTTPSASVRKPRKKKDAEVASPNTNGNTFTATVTDGQEPKVRKRAPRGTSVAYLKKQARLAEEAKAREAALQASRQAKITDSIPHTSSLPPSAYGVPAIHTPHQNGNSEAIHTPRINTQNVTPQSRPTSGQNYDPIRSSTLAPRPNSPMPIATPPQKPYSHSSASASPSIYSIIDPPAHPYTFPQPHKGDSDSKASSPPESKRPRLSPPLPLSSQQTSNSAPKEPASATSIAPASNATAMDIDTERSFTLPSSSATMSVSKPSPKSSTVASSSSHSPKPTRPKETAVAISSGSGLLSGSIFGTGLDSNGPERTAPTVVLNVPLTSEHQYVNFTRLAEERYGFNALHPRLAAQRERLAKVAAAGAALENANKMGGNAGSADDMSVDLSDGDADNSNVEMGGMNDGEKVLGAKSGEETGEAGAAKKPRKRMTKEDMYDKEDDFIDDAEEIWLEQAATSKDGFFVYSGPLIPPGEEPTVERADGPAKRGRGSGRGRGGTTRGGGRGGAAAAANKDGAKAPGRKPRVTKAAKEQMEKEKAQRENLAVLASKPVGYTIPV